ncbi:O-methyltransferase-domain-containing protein [Aspergillus spectabilis]
MDSKQQPDDTLIALAEDILRRATEFSQRLTNNGLPSLNLKVGACNTDPEDGSEDEGVRKSRYGLIDALTRLRWLALGPTEHVKSLLSGAALDAGTTRAIVKLNIPKAIPFESSISYEDLASQANVDCDTLTRIIRYCITNGICCEQPAGHIQHSAASAALSYGSFGQSAPWRAEIPILAGVRLFDAILAPSTNPGQRGAAFNTAYNTNDTIGPRVSPAHVVSAFAWSTLDGGTVVNVGGGTGHISKAIAVHYPKIKFIVQDLYRGFQAPPAQNRGQIEFQSHDFFSPQAVRADAFLFRYIFHNWSDADVVRIIQALKPALQEGTRLLVIEYLPRLGTGTGDFEEKTFRTRDMQMLALMNGKERSLDDYIQLVARADPMFSFVASNTPPGSSMTVLDWVYH